MVLLSFSSYQIKYSLENLAVVAYYKLASFRYTRTNTRKFSGQRADVKYCVPLQEELSSSSHRLMRHPQYERKVVQAEFSYVFNEFLKI